MFLLCEFTSEKTTILPSFSYPKGLEFNLIFSRSGVGERAEPERLHQLGRGACVFPAEGGGRQRPLRRPGGNRSGQAGRLAPHHHQIINIISVGTTL